jgi:hypothetical protein
MILIDGCDGVTWPIWYVLGWICGWDVVKTSCIYPTSESKSCHSPSISPINILLVHTIILQYVHMMLIDGCDGVIWSIWYVVGWIIVAGML